MPKFMNFFSIDSFKSIMNFFFSNVHDDFETIFSLVFQLNLNFALNEYDQYGINIECEKIHVLNKLIDNL